MKPNAINEKKVKIWSYLMATKDNRNSENISIKNCSPLSRKPKLLSVPGMSS